MPMSGVRVDGGRDGDGSRRRFRRTSFRIFEVAASDVFHSDGSECVDATAHHGDATSAYPVISNPLRDERATGGVHERYERVNA